MFIILPPFTFHNKSGQYVVVDSVIYERFTRGETSTYIITSRHGTESEATTARNRLNGELVKRARGRGRG